MSKIYIKMVDEPIELKRKLRDLMVTAGYSIFKSSRVFDHDVGGNWYLAKDGGEWCGHGAPPNIEDEEVYSITEYISEYFAAPLKDIYD